MRTRHIAATCLAASLCVGGGANAAISFALVDEVTRTNALTVAPGASFAALVQALGVTEEPGVEGNLDSFTYRIVFPNQAFTLASNAFSAPYDNNQPPLGFNGSVPWAGLPLAISNAADAGSPGSTLAFADLYRTTATQLGNALGGAEIPIETLGLVAPVALGVYPIAIQVLEAADNLGAFHTVLSNAGLTVTVVPEPGTVALLLAGLLTLSLALRRRT